MSLDRITVIAPATLSNLGSGFDVFGLALKEPYDSISARKIEERTIIIDRIEGKAAASITMDPERNSSGIAAKAVLDRAKADFGIAITIKKGIRPCSGIGSSGASAAGGAYAANRLLDKPLRPEELVFCAAQAEKGTSGSFHADNVGPCIMGGFTVIKSYDPFEIIRVDTPNDLGVVVTMPDFLVNTKDARKVIPSAIDLKSMVFEVGNAASLAIGICQGNVDLIGRSMMDVIIEPARARLNPHLKEAEIAAVKSGASGAFLGGSGPCVISVFDKSRSDGNAIVEAVKKVYSSNGIVSEAWITSPGAGCREVL